MVSDVERWAALHKPLSLSGPQFPNSKHEPRSTAFQAQPLLGPLPYPPISILSQLPSTPGTTCESSLRRGQATWNPWAEVWSVACTPAARPEAWGSMLGAAWEALPGLGAGAGPGLGSFSRHLPPPRSRGWVSARGREGPSSSQGRTKPAPCSHRSGRHGPAC